MSGAEEFRLEEAFVVIDGRATYTTDATFKVAAAINETKFLDEDSTDQMEHLAKFTNSTILAVNQHAVLLLNNLQRCSKMEKSIQQLQAAVEKCLPLIDRVTTAEDEHRIVTAQISSQRNAINAVEEELKRELILRDERERDNIKRRDEMIQHEIMKREQDRADRERIEATISSRLDTVENRMGAVEKDTLWKISDCQDLLKIRPTQEVVVNLIDDLEKRLTDLTSSKKRPSDSHKTGDPSPDILQIREDLLSMEMKISKLENK